MLSYGCVQSQVQQREENTAAFGFYAVEAAPEWSDLFYKESGWFGADGIFAIPANGKEAPGYANNSSSYLFFSDTMIGKAVEGSVFEHSDMVNNSVAIIHGDEPDAGNIEFYWAKNKEGEPKSLFTPQTPNSKEGEYLWLGDGFVNQEKDDRMYLFAYRIQSTDTGMGFKETGNILIVIPPGSNPPFKNHRQLDTPLFLTGNDNESYGSFGAGVFVNTEAAEAPDPDGYVYVYGVKGQNKQLLAARVQPENFENFNHWEYWSQDGWDSDINSAVAITDSVSNELSVYPVEEDKYVLIFQINGIGSNVGMRIGESPVGPFRSVKKLWNTEKISNKDDDFFAYNAKVHTNLSKPGELLISYNINSFDFLSDLKNYPNLYRPRFIRLTLEESN